MTTTYREKDKFTPSTNNVKQYKFSQRIFSKDWDPRNYKRMSDFKFYKWVFHREEKHSANKIFAVPLNETMKQLLVTPKDTSLYAEGYKPI